ncbi:hypothetical protein OG2516_03720 [Oceanicola granulosus HTCC2516]|uniref:HD domain-containing protein n=1 Tax=Oceanicola granulosus (strain ATCC BAA-861 / DSM 15982 / KCTC 12143 / HTCC2516) TaxID=314256 RepID=Q2CG67_OCEGH|nr:HD domain-containing protein [Oceanicola granulosus]EAR51662.1 hypothetical protein OG2516_03720 [Oceanicola granulosus HTCC2516]
MAAADRLAAQLAFLVAADGLKAVPSGSRLMDDRRAENAAEAAWHRALWALAFADSAPAGTDLDRALALCLLHDLDAVAPARVAAARADWGGARNAEDLPDRPGPGGTDTSAPGTDGHTGPVTPLFALLPAEQGAALAALHAEARHGDGPAARFVRTLALAQPLLQTLAATGLTETDRDAARAALTTGEAAALRDDWPELHAHATALLDGAGLPAPEPLGARLRFLAEADRLKGVLRATGTFDGTRRENSAEHSWHLALYAIVLPEHAAPEVRPARSLKMLVLHDLVEIDAGDVPVHALHDAALQAAREERAAARLFGLLPGPQGAAFRALWDEFEAAVSPDAVFAKALDRVQPVMANLATDGGTWTAYAVTREQLEARVGTKVRRGAAPLWSALEPRLDAWFSPRD